ncbi:hypothetical protein N7507_004014 [Penicillium longicatenatum]|nr:hypothetical protein N7507_004014 [Penicillium longicatenatum]
MIHPKTLAEHPCSRLESLPVEIIELIFLHSLEINLPRASLHLGRALSSPTLYTWLIRLVFSSTNPGSQSGFFTLDFLPPPLNFWEDQETMRDLGPRFEDLELHDRPRMGESRGKGDLVIHAQLPGDKTSRATTKKKQRASSLRNHVDRKVAIWFHYGAVQIREPNEIYYENDLFRLPSSTAIGPGRIPDKLLRLPWSDSQFDFLHLLSSDFYVDEDEYSNIRSTEITSRLIRRRNSEPFRQLLQMSFRSAHCRIPSRWPLQRLHYYLVRRCAEGKGDPFASAILYERWNDLTTTVDEDLMKFFEKQAEDLS